MLPPGAQILLCKVNTTVSCSMPSGEQWHALGWEGATNIFSFPPKGEEHPEECLLSPLIFPRGPSCCV